MPIIIEPGAGEVSGRTFKELQEEVLSFQFNEGKYLPLVKRWLNDAVQKIALQSEIRTAEERLTFTTTAGSGTESLPEDFGRTIDFFETAVPYQMARYEAKEIEGFPTSSGRPTSYAVLGNELNLWPTPDSAYVLALRYWKLSPLMVTDTDEPSLPPQYHDLPIAYAMMKAYARENDYQASAFWKAEWEAGISKMRGEAQYDTADGPTQLGGTWGGEPEWTTPLMWRP